MDKNFSDIFPRMDNKKGKKGKLFFQKLFMIDYVLKIIISHIKFVTELVTDNGKGKKR